MNDTLANNAHVANETPLPIPVSERRIGGRYRVVKLLKKERAAEHFLAEDTHGASVVVCCRDWSNLTPDTRQRVEHEAEILRGLQSPGLAGVLDIGQDGDSLYVVRPHVPGITLRRRLRDGPLDLQDTLAVGQSLFSALVALHSHGVLHHDIRPANLIVDAESPLRRAVLTDFSVNCCFRPEELSAEELIEVAVYRSPEYAGSLKYDVAEPSDLYSAGIVLFECLAGHPPFSGDNVGDTLLRHMTARVPELRNVGEHVPRAMDELVQRLLHKDPRDRYQSAEAVLMDLNSIMEAARSGMAEPSCVVGCHDHRTTLTEPAFVGRQGELEQVEEQIRQVAARQTGLVFLEAESGGGKTRFLAEVALRGVQANMWVLHGRGLEMVGGRPFQVLHGIVEDVVAEARSNPSFAETLHERLGDHADAVGAVLPELARSLGWRESAPAGPEGFAETWSIQALAAFLDALGTEDRPAMIILDDCQWADATTVKLIAHWRRERANSAGEGSSTLLIVAFRSEEVAAEHPLRKIRPTLHLRLTLLVAEEMQHLLESMAGPLPAEAVEVVYGLSEGSPFMASAVLRGMVESGALLAEPMGWRIEPLALADLHSSSRAAGFLSRRIELLPQDTLEFLTIGAVLGKEFDLNLAAKFLSLSTSQAVTTLDTARERHLVWIRPNGAECIFVHDKIRAALLARVTPKTRQDLHLRVARHLQQEDTGRIFDLAYHFDAAGDYESALPYALQAAEQARAQYALEIAEGQYRIAQRGADSTDRATRYEITKGLGDVLMLRGHYSEAGEVFQTALGLADGTFAEAEIRGKLGELDFKRGDMANAALAYQEALRLLGKPFPQKTVLFVLAFLWELVVQVAHTLFPRLFVSQHNRTPTKPELLRLQLLTRLAYAYWFTRGKVQAFSAHLVGMNLSERYVPSLELAHIYSSHAMAMTLIGWYSRGIAYAQKSLDIRRALKDLWGEGQSLSFYGCVLYAASRFNECMEKCREAMRLLESTGDRWELHIAMYQIAASLYRLGDMRGAIQVAQRLHKSGLELGDEQASSISLDVWARATRGMVPEDILAQEVDRKRPDGQSKAQILLAQGVQLTESGLHEQAVAVFEQGVANGKPIMLISAYAAPNLAWLATALRRQAESETRLTPDKRTKLLERAQKAARRAIRIGRRLQNDLPHALRELALIRAMQGKTRRVRQLLDESLTVADRQHARFEYAQTLLVRGKLGRELGWAKADEQVREAEAMLQEMTIPAEITTPGKSGPSEPATLSLADRFDTVLDAGRTIASALSPDAIYKEAAAAAIRLLRVEHCSVLEIVRENGEEKFRPISGTAVEGFRVARLREALEAGRAITYAEPAGKEDTSATTAQEDRSALCVPVLVRGRAVACLYVAHEQVHGLFGPDEERLADFIATIAGAALENAEGFQQLQDLNETLEARVAERTAAAEARARELATSNRELELLTTDLQRTEEQLRVAKEAAEAANKAKSKFLAMMSHEIRTPMNGIVGMTELAMATSLTPEQQRYLNVVKLSADCLLNLINDILDFSKIEAEKMELENISFDVREVVGDSAQLLTIRAAEKGVDLFFRVAPDVPETLAGDPGRVRQILVNLLGNAIKFTEYGEVYANVWLKERTEQSVRLHCTVQDTGIGIPADKLDCLFESFSQVDRSTTRRFGGTGLGLAISAKLVDLMHGKIWAESEPGKGSTFHFTAEFDAAGDEESAVPVLPPKLEALPVLLVADHPRRRSIYEESLTRHGMRPTVVADANAALEELDHAAAAGTPYRLAVIDADAHGGNCWPLIDRIHDEHSQAECAVIALVSAGQAGIPNHYRHLSGIQFLTKPAKYSELIDAAASLLGGGRQKASTGDEAARNVRCLHILLAEDGLVNQEVAVGLLEMQGHNVEIANNGREALDALERQNFDVVLMDLEMPEMDGMEATVAIRERELTSGGHVPIIAMTAHAMKGFRERCLQSGMDDFITKPIKPEELYKVVQDAAARQPAQG